MSGFILYLFNERQIKVRLLIKEVKRIIEEARRKK